MRGEIISFLFTYTRAYGNMKPNRKIDGKKERTCTNKTKSNYLVLKHCTATRNVISRKLLPGTKATNTLKNE
jgi:hypothetical protein